MIVDNYSDTEIFLSSSFIKLLKLISLKVISPSSNWIWIEVGDGSDRSFSVVETEDCIIGF